MSFLFRFWVAMIAGWIHEQQRGVIAYKDTEIRSLREQLREATGTDRLRFTDAQRRRLAVNAKKLGRAILREIDPPVTPDTLLRWHRKLIARKYDSSHVPKVGRPPLDQRVKDLIVRMARASRWWGYKHLSGELAKLGHKACPTTVANVLRAHGLDPLPRRRNSKLTWNEFLNAHWDSLMATDFFSVEVWHGFKLIRYSVLFVIDLPTRKVDIIGIAPDPDGQWMKQMARNVTDAFDGPLRKGKLLIHDRDPLFTTEFRSILGSVGVACKKLPPRSPNLNAYAERFVRSIKQECLDNFIFVSEKQLRHVIGEYVEHYNRERPHQGIGNVVITPPDSPLPEAPALSIHPCATNLGRVQCRERLGGMLKHYYRKAA